jgi:transcriptional regulator with XRE-family HTH domain
MCHDHINDVVTYIGRAIKARRNKLGASLREVARDADMSYVFLCNCENGKSRMTYDRLYSVAIALNTTIGRLFSGL